MGCVDSKTNDQVSPMKPSAAAGKRLTVSFKSRSPEPAVTLVTPGLVQHLGLVNDPSAPSISFSWEPPANLKELGEEVLQYDVKITPSSTSRRPGIEDSVMGCVFEVDGKDTMMELTPELHGIRPLCGYVFSVRAKSSYFATGEWNDIEGFVDWLCRLPGCRSNRLTLDDGTVYNYCSRAHKIDYDEGFCLYPQCSNPIIPASPPSSPSSPASPSSNSSATYEVLVRDADHFCSKDHAELTLRRKNTTGAFFLYVDPKSQEFERVEALFRSRWSTKEKKCPSLTMVLSILNPSLNKRFTEYANSHAVLKKDRKELIKPFYFGTTLGCDLHNHQDICSNVSNFSKCGICNLSCEGFGKIVSPMIPLDKNPADAHFKTDAHKDSIMYGIMMCDVVSGTAKRTNRKLSTSTSTRPEGVDAVKVRCGSIIGRTDSILIYNADAVCPRYILMYV